MNRPEGTNGLPGMNGVKVVTGAAAAVLLLAVMDTKPASADTIEAALVRAYQTNPQLNAQRATVRSTDENVPQALSGYRPRVALTASAGYQYTDTLNTFGGTPTQILKTDVAGANAQRSPGLTISHTLYNRNHPPYQPPALDGALPIARAGPRVLAQAILRPAASAFPD